MEAGRARPARATAGFLKRGFAPVSAPVSQRGRAVTSRGNREATHKWNEFAGECHTLYHALYQ